VLREKEEQLREQEEQLEVKEKQLGMKEEQLREQGEQLGKGQLHEKEEQLISLSPTSDKRSRQVSKPKTHTTHHFVQNKNCFKKRTFRALLRRSFAVFLENCRIVMAE
jgi:hypothetical protein